MIPVTQTKVGIRNSAGELIQNGNCWAAAIASLLEIPISEVPNFEVWFNTDVCYIWYDLTQCFLIQRGHTLEYDNRFKVFHHTEDEWNTVGDDWYDKYAQMGEYHKLREELKDQYYLVSGPSPRGVSHATIWQNGVMVHDPHPTREGILELKTFEVIRPLIEEEKQISKDYKNNYHVALPSIKQKVA